MSKTGEIPYAWDQIEREVRKAIAVQADILACYGPFTGGPSIPDYLGISEDAYGDFSVENFAESPIDIRRHGIWHHVKIAYDYAYQLDGAEEASVDTLQDVDGLLLGFPQADSRGEPSPLCPGDPPLRCVLENFQARFLLFEEWGLNPTVRQLALMANMTIPAVRTSLSKEGFRLDKAQCKSADHRDETVFRLNDEDAKLWLSRRRGFIPQRTDSETDRVAQQIVQTLSDRSIAFPDMVRRVIKLRGTNATALATGAGLDPEWLSDLVAAHPVAPDVAAFQTLARALDVPEPDFVGFGIRHTLLVEATAAGA